MSRAHSGWVVPASLLCVLLRTEPVSAIDAVVDAQSSAQFYAVTSPAMATELLRRRQTHTLSVAVTDWDQWVDPGTPALRGFARLRLDADLGIPPETARPARDAAFIPGTEPERLDLMEAYIEGHHYLRGHAGFRFGRQYVVDPIGWWSFDGGLVEGTSARVTARLYAGFEQREGPLPLSTSRFEQDGVQRGSRFGMDANEWPSFLESSRLAPAYGGNLTVIPVGAVEVGAAFRHVQTRDRVVTRPFSDAALPTTARSRTSSQLAALSLHAPLLDRLAAAGNSTYDLLLRRVRSGATEITWRAEDWQVGADTTYDYAAFDGDSVFNWFVHEATSDAAVRAGFAPTPASQVTVRVGARRYAGSWLESSDRSQHDFIATVGGQQRFGATTTSAWLDTARGERGHRQGGDVALTRTFWGGFYDASARLSLYDFRDALRDDGSLTSFTYVASGGLRPAPGTRASVEWEHSMNDRVGSRTRLTFALRVEVPE